MSQFKQRLEGAFSFFIIYNAQLSAQLQSCDSLRHDKHYRCFAQRQRSCSFRCLESERDAMQHHTMLKLADAAGRRLLVRRKRDHLPQSVGANVRHFAQFGRRNVYALSARRSALNGHNA